MGNRRPLPGEYSDYHDTYIGLVPDGDIIEILEAQRVATLETLNGIDESRAEYRYAPGKWTTKEVVGHVIDFEWIFTYRGLRIARGAADEFSGIDQNELAENADLTRRSLGDLAGEFSHLRQADCAFFRGLDQDTLGRSGTAGGFRLTVRAIPYIIAGHERHHMNVLRQKYLYG